MTRGSWQRSLRRAGGALRTLPWRTIETALGVGVLALLLTEPARLTLRVGLTMLFGAAASFVSLLGVDGGPTAWSAALALAKMSLASVPAVLMIRTAPRHRWLWLIPLVTVFVFVSAPLSLTACATLGGWLLLAATAAAAALCMRVRWLRWTFALPFLLLCAVAPRHGFNPETAAEREQLLVECARRAGTRPPNLHPDLLLPYHGITLLGDDLALLTAEGANDGAMRGHAGGRRVGSWWLRRENGAFRFERPSEATGNLWRGCVLEGTIWMGRANNLVGAKRIAEGAPRHEEVYRWPIPADEVDFGETACLPDRRRVYVAEATKGGLWEVGPDGQHPRRHPIGGILLLPRARSDGRIVLTNTASLVVFDAEEGQVVERVGAGFAILGSDLCARSGAVAVADMAGRVRVFELDDAGHYRFAWGVSLFAPRRIAFSPDCTRLAVTSADDYRLFIVDTQARAVIDVLDAGPGLREVMATGPREFSVADVCSITTHRW